MRELFDMFFMRSFFIIILLQQILSCQPVRYRTVTLSRNAAYVKLQMKQLIRAGSDIHDAEKLLNDEGFTCRYMTNEDFAKSSGKGEAVYHRNKSFLYCSLEKSTGCLSLISERWQICIVHKEMKTEDVFVSYGLTGP